MQTFPNLVVASPDVLFQELGGESVLLNLANEQYYGLNEVGTRMWQLLTSTNSVEVTLQTMAQEYAVSSDKLYEDIQVLLKLLTENGLLQVGN